MSENTTEPTPAESTEVEPPEDSEVMHDASPDEAVDEDQDDAEQAETFPREVVEKLRKENSRYRQRAQQADTYATRLHLALVAATGKLADPSDLEFDEDHLADPDNMVAAIEDLLERKPHLASRKPVGDIGQGQRGASSEPFSLLGLLKERT